MNVVREITETPRKSFVTTIEIPEPKVKTFWLSRKDLNAIDSVKGHYGVSHIHEAAMKMLEERGQLKQLTLTEGDNAQNMVQLPIESKEFKRLEKEANKLGLNISEYVRAVLYTTSQLIIKERAAKREEAERMKQDNRIVKCEVELDKEIRNKLYKLFGQVTDKELIKITNAILTDFVKTL